MALTNRWVTDSGAGAADGTSEANAMSFATFLDYMVTGGSFTAAPGDVFLLVGVNTSRTTTTDTWVNGGNGTSPVVVRGVVTGGGTAYQGRTNSNGDLIVTNFSKITYTTGRLNITGAFIILENLDITGAGNGMTLTTGADSLTMSCRVTNSGTNASSAAFEVGNRNMVVNCDVRLTGASGGSFGMRIASGSGWAYACRCSVLSSAASSVVSLQTLATGIKLVVIGAGGKGVDLGSAGSVGWLIDSTVVGCADAVDAPSTNTRLIGVIGSLLTDNSGFGIDANATTVSIAAIYNRFRANSGGNTNSGTDWLSAATWGSVTTGAASDYVNLGTFDLNLIASSPAVSAGLPAFASMGALQRSQTSSGGLLRHPGMTGGINA